MQQTKAVLQKQRDLSAVYDRETAAGKLLNGSVLNSWFERETWAIFTRLKYRENRRSYALLRGISMDSNENYQMKTL